MFKVIKSSLQRREYSEDAGFILPTVLLISIAMIAVGLSLVQSTSSINQSLEASYVSRLASEGSNSGLVYANYCFKKFGMQSWSASGGRALTQSTDCSGNPVATYPKSVLTYNNYYVTFSLADIVDGRTQTSTGNVATKFTPVATPVGNFPAIGRQTVGAAAMQASFSAAGSAKTCGVISGAAYCWGLNSGSWAGQLGDNTTNTSYTAVKVYQELGVMAGKTVSTLAAGEVHVCALAVGVVYCWGQNSQGQLGTGNYNASLKPVQVHGLLDNQTVTAIGAADRTMCAITAGKIYCWGDNAFGTAGTGDPATSKYNTPTLLTTGLPQNYVATQLATGDSYSQTMCAIVNSKSYCWGDNRTGTIGNGTVSANVPVLSPTATSTPGGLSNLTIQSIAVEGSNKYVSNINSSHACEVTSDYQLYCWGSNDQGQLGMGNTIELHVPTKVSAFTGKTVKAVGNGVSHTCALMTDPVRQPASDWVYCMGSNQYGQQGANQAMGSGTHNYSPVPIVDANNLLTNKPITSLSGGANRSCLIANYSTFCWGWNIVGQIGDNSTQDRNVPTLSTFLQPAVTGYLF